MMGHRFGISESTKHEKPPRIVPLPTACGHPPPRRPALLIGVCSWGSTQLLRDLSRKGGGSMAWMHGVGGMREGERGDAAEPNGSQFAVLAGVDAEGEACEE